MAEVKGSMLNAWMAYLGERYDQKEISAAIQGLSQEDRSRFDVKFLDSSWYPIQMSSSMTRLTIALTKRPDAKLAVQVGRYMARYVYTHVYRNLIGSDPMTHMEKFSWIDELMYRGLRTFYAERAGPSSCRVSCRYEPGQRPPGTMCGGLEGFFLEVLEMTGGLNVKGTHSVCVLKGADSCEFDFEWELPESGQ